MCIRDRYQNVSYDMSIMKNRGLFTLIILRLWRIIDIQQGCRAWSLWISFWVGGGHCERLPRVRKNLGTLGLGWGACCSGTCVQSLSCTSLPSLSLHRFRSNWMVQMNVDKEWLRIKGALGIHSGLGNVTRAWVENKERVNIGNELFDLAGENGWWFFQIL